MRTHVLALALMATLTAPRVSASGWNIETIVPYGNHADLAVDASGHPHVLFNNCVAWEWCEPDGPRTLTYGVRDGPGWSFETVANNPSGSLTSIVIDASGEPRIAYCDSLYQMHYGVHNAGVWSLENLYHPHPAYLRFNPALTLDTNGDPHIAFIERESVQYAHKVSGVWADEDITSSWLDNYAARCAIEVDSNDSVRVGTGDYYTGAVLYTRGASSWSASHVGGVISYYTWMALDANDAVHFVYVGSGGLYYATNAGGGWSEEIIDGQGTEEYDDVVIDAGGRPFVVYTRATIVQWYPLPDLYDLDVYLAWRDNGVWATDLIASADSVGSWHTDPRLAIDPFDVVHVVYRNPETGELFYATREQPTAARATPASPNAITGVVPNPFNPSTEVVFRLASDDDVALEVYDVTGRRVRSLLRGSLGAGEHRVAWDGRTDAGTAASGVYFFRLTTTRGNYTRRGVLAK